MNSWSLNLTGTPSQIAEALRSKRHENPDTQAAWDRAKPLIEGFTSDLDEKKKYNLTASGQDAGEGVIMTINIQPR